MQEEREPICGFCWAHRRTRQPLNYKIQHGFWECPVCKIKIVNPADEELLKAEYDPDPHRFKMTIASTLRLRGSGSKSSRRKKKVAKKPPRPRSPQEEQAYIRRYNERLKQEAAQKR